MTNWVDFERIERHGSEYIMRLGVTMGSLREASGILAAIYGAVQNLNCPDDAPAAHPHQSRAFATGGVVTWKPGEPLPAGLRRAEDGTISGVPG